MTKNAQNLVDLLKRFEDLEKQGEQLQKDLLPVVKKITDSEIQQIIEKYPQYKKMLN